MQIVFINIIILYGSNDEYIFGLSGSIGKAVASYADG